MSTNDGEGAARRRYRSDTPRTMRQVMPGLYDGPELRAERVDGLWRTQARMSDVGRFAEGSPSTGLSEYHPDGDWTNIGAFRTLRLAEVALEVLKAGTHLVHRAHGKSLGESMRHVPTRVIPYAEAREIMVEYGLVEADPVAEETGPVPFRG